MSGVQDPSMSGTLIKPRPQTLIQIMKKQYMDLPNDMTTLEPTKRSDVICRRITLEAGKSYQLSKLLGTMTPGTLISVTPAVFWQNFIKIGTGSAGDLILKQTVRIRAEDIPGYVITVGSAPNQNTPPPYVDFETVERALTSIPMAYRNYSLAEPLQVAGNDGIVVSPKPWWSEHGYGYPNFEDWMQTATAKWRTITGTVTMASDAGYVRTGNYAMKLVTGATAGNTASARVKFNLCRQAYETEDGSTYQIFEWLPCLNAAADTTPRYMTMELKMVDKIGGVVYQFGIRYKHYLTTAFKRWQYLNNAGTYVDFYPFPYEQLYPLENYFPYVHLMTRRDGNGMYYALFQVGTGGFQWTKGYNDACNMPAIGTDLEGCEATFSCETDAAAATTAYLGAFLAQDRTRSPFG